MKKFYFLIICVLTSITSLAQIEAGAALIALDEFETSIENSIDDIGLIADNAIGDTGNMILSALGRLRADIKSTIGETDHLLRSNQQLLFNNLSNEIHDFDKKIKSRQEDLDITATRVSTALQDFIRKKNEPRILKFETPTYVVDSNEDYVVEVVGEDFDRPYFKKLVLENKEMEITEWTQRTMKVIIPKDVMASLSNDSKRFLTAKFVFKYRSGFFKRKKQKEFQFVIPCVPKIIGQVTAYYEQKIINRKYYPTKIHKLRVRTGSTGSSGKRKKKSSGVNILPVNGRFIDPTSVKITNFYKRYSGGYNLSSITEQQIKGILWCKSKSKRWGGGGKASLTLTYQEFENTFPLSKNQTATMNIKSDNLTIIPLPDPTENGDRPVVNYVEITTFDGKNHILSLSNTHKYFDLRQNESTDDLELSLKY